MLRKRSRSQFTAGTGDGLFRHHLLRLVAAASVVLVVTILVVSSVLAARSGSNSADEVHFFQGDKTCHQNSSPPYIVCVITTSDVALLQGASVAYTSNPPTISDPAFGRIESDVVLTTTEATPSTAYGHCTFYFATGTGLCTYTHGTKSLAGFHATLVIGTNSDGTYSVIGKYGFGDNSQ
jgi:hypothetical protein